MAIEDPQRPHDHAISPPSRRRRRRVAGDPRAADHRAQLQVAAADGHATASLGPRLAPRGRPAPDARRTRAQMHAAEEKAIDSVLSYTPAVTSGGEQGPRARAHLRRRARPLHPAARGRAQPPARARDVLRDRRGGALLLSRHEARAALGRRGRRPHRDAPDDGLALGARTARRARRTDRPHRTARRAAAAPVPSPLRLVRRDHLPHPSPAAPADGAVVDRHERLHAAGRPRRSCRARSRARIRARSS